VSGMKKFFRASLPYNGTEGYAASEPSEERATRRARNGRAEAIQQQVWDMLTAAGPDGVIYTEVRDKLGVNSNIANPALSVLHKDGRIAKLSDKRDGCGIYVHIAHINGREVVPHGGMDKDKWEAIGIANGWLISD
jgi:hypothetical protein